MTTLFRQKVHHVSTFSMYRVLSEAVVYPGMFFFSTRKLHSILSDLYTLLNFTENIRE